MSKVLVVLERCMNGYKYVIFPWKIVKFGIYGVMTNSVKW